LVGRRVREKAFRSLADAAGCVHLFASNCFGIGLGSSTKLGVGEVDWPLEGVRVQAKSLCGVELIFSLPP
jgi:hypothetical protein